MMKFLCLAVLPMLLARAAKVKTVKQSVSYCPAGVDNRYPNMGLPEEVHLVDTATGAKSMHPLDSVFDIAVIRSYLKADPQWVIDKYWFFSAKFYSDSSSTRHFSFSGDGPAGFLKFTVPAGVQGMVINATDEKVMAPGDKTELQYEGPGEWTSGKIIMSQICFGPRTCALSLGCNTKSENAQPASSYEYPLCCTPKKCTETSGACSPSTQWRKRPDFDNKSGYNNETCCFPIACAADMCENQTKWKDKPGSGHLGSTFEECCDGRLCQEYGCKGDDGKGSHSTKKCDTLPDGSIRYGSTDEECCEPTYCSDFDCGNPSLWKHKDGANSTRIGIDGQTNCCERLLCAGVCPNNTKWVSNPKKKYGSTLQQCCTPLFCASWTCQDDMLAKLPGATQRRGNTDEECCEPKRCRNYKCSDDTKWVHNAVHELDNNMDSQGFSDLECCKPKWCRDEVCYPTTMWSAKDDIGRVQGSLPEQCCNRRYCESYVCDTDSDGDGVGTAWYKRIDTNQHKFQGHTNEECCEPIYCSQFTTHEVTKWRRKQGPDLQGSTEEECYDPISCKDYCCDEPLKKRLDAAQIQGSTDEECCVNASIKSKNCDH